MGAAQLSCKYLIILQKTPHCLKTTGKVQEFSHTDPHPSEVYKKKGRGPPPPFQ